MGVLKRITKDQCNNLVKFPDTNPMTNKKFNKKTLNGIYKKLLKECDELYADKKSIQTSIMKSLELTLGNMDTVETRVHNLKIMRKYISMISPCIVSSNITSHILALVKKDKGRFKDIIYFNKQIGSDSEFGVAYVNTGVGEGSKLVFATKIMPDKYDVEVKLLEKMSSAVQRNITPNFPIIYKILHCKNMKEASDNENHVQNNITNITKHRYFVILNEIANGDMIKLLNIPHSPIEFESILMQVFISLRTFHTHTHYMHNDCHFGNFLYHKIKKGGYWHYKYNETDIYVPNTGYLVVLWDPGLAKPIQPGTEYMPFTDYYRFYGILKYHIEYGIIDLPQDIYLNIKLLIQYISYKSSDVNAIMKYLEKKPKFNYILYEPPLHNSYIINDKPYPL
jgi:hypothetical protein